MEVIKAWGLTPERWRLLSVDDRARMVAHEMIKAIRTAWKMEQDELLTEGSGRPGKKPLTGMDEFKAMKARAGIGG
jgi:hypothetical protein